MEGRGGSEEAPGLDQWHCPALPLLLPGQLRELVETLPVLLLLLLLCGLDWALYSIFDTVRHHSFVQYSFRSEPSPHSRLQAQGDNPLETSHPCAATPSQFVQFLKSLLYLAA